MGNKRPYFGTVSYTHLDVYKRQAFEWASTTIKKQLTKDFTASESDIDSIQQVMDLSLIHI